MRWLRGGVVVAIAGLVGACGALTGLGKYSDENCPADGCDASVQPKHDGSVTPPADTGTDAEPADDGSSSDDSGEEAGDGGCSNTCATDGACVNFMTDLANCGMCGMACVAGQTCINGQCAQQGLDSGVPCPDGGCPVSAATGYSCPFGSCNGTSSQCTNPSGCFCSNDTLCLSGKCVKITGENDVSCGAHCTGTGSRDGFDCELASPGIPSLSTGVYSCPANSGFNKTTLVCDPTHTNCYCNDDNQCPSGKCIPSTNNASCSPGGPCTGTGTADYRGCESIAGLPSCPIYIGCPSGTSECSYPTCYCTTDKGCESGHCIPSSHNGNCSGCTGTGTDDGHGCMVAPSSVACAGTGGSTCTTTLTPTPVLNSGHTACLCVADSNCSSGKCVNANSQCSGTCTGASPADNNDCRTAASVANTWSCPLGNCSDVTSPAGSCTAAGVPCWCTSDSQCATGTICANWAGCASGACTGSGAGNAFHCVP